MTALTQTGAGVSEAGPSQAAVEAAQHIFNVCSVRDEDGGYDPLTTGQRSAKIIQSAIDTETAQLREQLEQAQEELREQLTQPEQGDPQIDTSYTGQIKTLRAEAEGWRQQCDQDTAVINTIEIERQQLRAAIAKLIITEP